MMSDVLDPSTRYTSNARRFWSDFVRWAASHQIDYYAGRKVAPWLAEDGMTDVSAEAHTIVHNGGSEFSEW